VAPEKVALPIAVDVTDALNVPIVGDGSVHHGALAFDLQAIHLPEINRPVVVAPQKVAA
jgi:hypothetical protein